MSGYRAREIPSLDDVGLVRFEQKIIRTDGCWHWIGTRDSHGYGVFMIGRSNYRAHRVAYTCFVGPVPTNLVMDHLCNNPGCVNPAHVRPATQRENILRGVSACSMARAKTHCPQGHEYSAENTYMTTEGGRACRLCGRAYRRSYYHANKDRWTIYRATLERRRAEAK